MKPSVESSVWISSPPFDARFLNALSEGLSEAILAADLNSRRIVYWNQTAEALFQFSKKELEQQTMDSLFSDRLVAEQIGGVALPQLLEDGFWRGECEYRRHDGSCFGALTTLALLKTPENSYILATIRDISERKERDQVIHWLNQQLAQRFTKRASELIANGKELQRAEHDRRLTKQLLDILLRNLTDNAILFLSKEGYVIHSKGTEQLLGYVAEDLDGIHFSRLFKETPTEQHRWNRMLESAARQANVREYEWLRRKDDAHIHARVEIVGLRDDAGALNGYIIFLRDDTEQRKIREQLREKEHLATIGTATAMLAHEIRNPLNGMSTTVQFLERSLKGNFEPTREMVLDTIGDLKAEISRLQGLLGEFHVISHPQQTNPQPVDLAELIHGLIPLATPESLKEKVKTIEQLHPSLPTISGDPDKLKQVFLNLVKNAFEAMPEGGTLTVNGHASGSSVYIEITDTGVGIPDGLNVFDLFRSTKAHGTGLGLAIARQIILAHNGSIDYSSKPGMTTFRVALPIPSDRPAG